MERSEQVEPLESDERYGTGSGNPLEAVVAAAVDAELETGAHEHDERDARAHLLIRLLRGAGGILVIAVGVALTVLPGPGVLLILGGLGLLAIDYPFAARLRDRLLHTGTQYAGTAGRILKRAVLRIALAAAITVSLVILLVAAIVVVLVRTVG